VQQLAEVAEELAENEESYLDSPEGQQKRDALLQQARELDAENISMQGSPELLFGQQRAGATPAGRNLFPSLFQEAQQKSHSDGDASSSRHSFRLEKIKNMKNQK